MKKYLWESSAAVVIGALRVKIMLVQKLPKKNNTTDFDFNNMNPVLKPKA